MTRSYDDIHHLASAPVVVGVDGSDADELALDWAAATAARRGREVRIVHGMSLEGLVRSYGRADQWVAPTLDAIRDHASALVERSVERIRQAQPGIRVRAQLYESAAAGLLVRESAHANLLVLGRHGEAGIGGQWGSILLTVTAHAKGSVVVVGADLDRSVQRQGPVVVGIDGSRVSEAATAAAFEEASARGAELVAVHIWSDLDIGWFEGVSDLIVPVTTIGETEREVLAERLAGWQEKYPDVKVRRRLYSSGPIAVLAHWSGQAQLLVLGSRGRGGFLGMLLGSTSNTLVRQAKCPVMVVHPTE
ncbi:universal stress protein [Nocardia pseudobrasiliensis]|uniref:Nucleotide-binding universal stress UspA family protein n=1 Tax=Nocardia pseudobrasiliensis TaxID=45979 RepID=A0A370HQ90_9NOCA|nr:universal stress protein [Nocardia pseudobrasiliensis]RDI60490.1 nucleotide-binding universal stress UspA family protein [Nocardia pseudobrasiliensis]